ncbi:MAG: CoA transferase [Acidimicrobiales bacterium]|jgi:CoA:oxalate CoA-transferase|nr:CoA transferase [Acidimicrobiales bacterium]MDP6298403.1 CoA transferase [Acidimicrobiales bacterium]HJM27528.1 CoA transferase [Acidimicrobiales bacterium]HJM98087.1 CoA transferase [Acidimicrobiales bacterium]
MESQRILEGIRVVDMTQYLAGPTVTRMMAEMGADIIKIEQAPGGDPSRNYAIINDVGRSGYFVQQNRGKKSLCLDFDHSDGKEILLKLLSSADVFVENYGPGVMERRGLDWNSMKDLNPRLIMASISGFGRDSSMSDRPAFDMIAQAFSGTMFMTGDPQGPPMPVGQSIADVMTGVHAVTAIGYALFHRERTGKGQFVDIAMVDALFHSQELAVQGPSLTGMKWKPKRSGHRSRINSPLGAFKGPEGWIVIQCMEAQWPRFVEAIGKPELLTDERFADLTGRTKNREELNEIIEEWMQGFENDQQILDTLVAARVPSAPVLAPYDAIGHPYFESRGAIREIKDPLLGTFHIPGDPLHFSDFPDPLELVAPTLGQHNENILKSLGFTTNEIVQLSDNGVIKSGDT